MQTKPDLTKYFSLESIYNELVPQTQQEMAWHVGDNGFDQEDYTFICLQ